ncbi:NLP/P60 family protein [Lachnospiraceae bacterium TWA4]|nr:NLP/P60 family protein [Lachnospiraceae bacterium TWA4]
MIDEEVNGYEVYRSDRIDGDFKKVGQTDGKTSNFVDTGLEMGHRYYYKIVAFREIEGSKLYSEDSFVMNIIPGLAQVEGVKSKQKSYNEMVLSWNETQGAKGYIVSMSDRKDSGYRVVSRVGITTLDDTDDKQLSTQTTIRNLVTGKEYYVKIQACTILKGKLKLGAESEVLSFKTNLSQPKNLHVEESNYQSAVLSWDKLSGATEYEVYRLNDKGEYQKVATVKENTYKAENLITGVEYTYKVQAVRNSDKVIAKSKPSSEFIVSTILNPVEEIKASEITTNSLKLNWKEVEGATGYLVKRSTSIDGEFAEIANIKNSEETENSEASQEGLESVEELKELSYNEEGLSDDTNYFYQIVAYRNTASEDEEEEIVNSEASIILTVKTNKTILPVTPNSISYSQIVRDAPVNIVGGTVVDYATSRVGCPYIWAASGPNSFDCSGLVMWSYRKAGGRSLPHNAQAQYNCTTHISRDNLQPGDLVFFGGSTSSINHVAIYIGGGMVVHAANPSSGVKYSSIDSASYSRTVGYSRVN